MIGFISLSEWLVTHSWEKIAEGKTYHFINSS